MTDIEIVRVATNEQNDDVYSDNDIDGMLQDNDGNLDATIAVVWRHKAARFSELANVSEGPASQDLGKLFDNAVKMAQFYEARAGDTGAGSSARPSVRKIERS